MVKCWCLDRTYEELKLGFRVVAGRNHERRLDRTYEELKLFHPPSAALMGHSLDRTYEELKQNRPEQRLGGERSKFGSYL